MRILLLDRRPGWNTRVGASGAFAGAAPGGAAGPMPHISVFFVSDQTGVTAETMGHSLLTQFEGLDFRQTTLPFVSTVDKAEQAVRRINATAAADGRRPIVFSTLVRDDVRLVVKRSEGVFLDFFDAFLGPLEAELAVKSSQREGRAHGMADQAAYTTRIDATNFALAADDGAVNADYTRADVVLIGVSRSGKTPTCVYMAMHYGIFAANYPLTDDDFEHERLPPALAPFSRKLFGLTIARDACSRSAPSAGPAAATRPSSSANTRCVPQNACSSATACRCSTPRSARSRRSRAGSSNGRESNAD